MNFRDDQDLAHQNPNQIEPQIVPSRRGFAAMAPEKHRAIASRGGKAAHALGRAHIFTPQEASAAGRKGGRKVSQDRAHMVVLGRKGALARGRALSAKAEQHVSSAAAGLQSSAYEVQR